ncbi:hypothetical protein O3G_MSEX010248 [Manduca sexta]|uniref:FAD dependent oxidoreductase domain-containing protein n=1 Tax=Manduca sexta TaxID=7130 RepID=A0A922CTI4_MANSE|nr:hypothetical protein O3G_MSEX010248 [Manduca sexta]
MTNLNIAVVGGGVVGYTVARLLQQELRNVNLTLIADLFGEDTTSCVAAGIFRPGPSFAGPNKQITKQWIDDSWYFFEDIVKSSEAAQAGVMRLSAYIFSKQNYHTTRNHLIEDIVPVYRPVEKDELKICGEGWKYGSYYETLKIECDKYLPWTEGIIKQNGAKIIQRKVDSLASLTEYDLVLNCTGMGAKYLCNDTDLVAIRGQVIKVRAPWLKYSVYGDYDTYVIPGFNGLATLGGVRQYDSYNMNVCKHDAAAIFERCCELVPSLKDAEIIGHRVGLRPHRVPVRLEPELVGGVKVVHCYGHGGYGVMCAPGTAITAVQIATEVLRTNFKSKM